MAACTSIRGSRTTPSTSTANIWAATSWGAPGHIWYDTLQRLNNPLATFFDWATATIDSAIRLYGLGSTEAVMLRRAWRLVGIKV